MEKPPSMEDQFLITINQIIEDNLDNENFSVEDLAQEARLSRSMLHRKLIKLTGKSATDYITEKRIFKAKELLENDVSTASEIAYKVGFKTPSYFNKVFKDYFHVSPGDVRKGALADSNQPYTDNKKKMPALPEQKVFSLRIVALIILLTIIVAGAVIFYISREKEPPEKSIAILPFDNLSSDKEYQYFADGIVEDLLFRLSNINELKVISRTSSEMFRNKGDKTLPQIADILGVSYILEGAVQRESNKIRVNIQLIDAQKDDHILSKQYNRNLSEIFVIQSDIASQIASELSLVLTDQQSSVLKQNKTKNPKAFELYQMGRFHSSKRLIYGLKKGIEYYEKAIAEDPNYGLAYAGLADNYNLMTFYDWIDLTEGKNKGIELALKAMELDPGLSEPHAVLGNIYHYIDWDWEKAEKELLKSIRLNPNYSTAHQYYSELLEITDRTDLAREHINKALELDPFSFVIHSVSGAQYYNQGQFRKALSDNKICEELVKDHIGPVGQEFDIYYQLGWVQEAIESMKRDKMLFILYFKLDVEQATESSKRDEMLSDYNIHTIVDSIYENEGLDGFLRLRIKVVPVHERIALWHAMLGEYDKAFKILDKLCYDKSFNANLICRYEFSKMRNDPRYILLLEKMGLRPYYNK